jgi:acylphosphatase
MRARHAVVRGDVQGVGFRFFAERAARGLGVRGWVRNRPDGTVETLAEGEEEAVGEYLARLRRGPSASRVDEVLVEDADPEGFTSFEVRR